MKKEEIIKMRIKRVEKEIRDTPYDKASEHHHGRLRAKLSRLKEDLDGVPLGGGGGGGGYAIKHSGDATVVLVGPPSVGKSTLLNQLTNAESKVGNYDFTTLGVIPGMMEYKGVRVQILDLPGLLEGAFRNKGFGKKVLSVIRASDLVVLMTDVGRLEWLKKMEKETDKAGIRLNQKRPKIEVKKMPRGAIQVIDSYKGLKKEVVVSVVKEMGYSNAVVNFGEEIKEVEKLIDVLAKSRKYLPMIRVVNKIDNFENHKSQIINHKLKGVVYLSAEKGLGLNVFREKIWEGLGLMRVYLKKERNKEADKKKPLIVKKDQSLTDVLGKISSSMKSDIKRACIWGKKAKFPGQNVSLKIRVFDEMEVWFGR
ncbi:50S ribosome-binding GTPase [Patescibacteria group bacterium]|nr:50S ribosome-binding GTPase [Patescibacteria group bacterium]